MNPVTYCSSHDILTGGRSGRPRDDGLSGEASHAVDDVDADVKVLCTWTRSRAVRSAASCAVSSAMHWFKWAITRWELAHDSADSLAHDSRSVVSSLSCHSRSVASSLSCHSRSVASSLSRLARRSRNSTTSTTTSTRRSAACVSVRLRRLLRSLTGSRTSASAGDTASPSAP